MYKYNNASHSSTFISIKSLEVVTKPKMKAGQKDVAGLIQPERHFLYRHLFFFNVYLSADQQL